MKPSESGGGGGSSGGATVAAFQRMQWMKCRAGGGNLSLI